MHFKEGVHLCNHLSNSLNTFTNKVACLEALEELRIKMEKGEVVSFLNFSEFQPPTYRLDFVADLAKFLNTENDGLWLVKKANSNQGKGISFISDLKAYKEELLTVKEQEPDSTDIFLEKLKENVEAVEQQIQEKKKWQNLNHLVKTMEKTVVQRYIEKPLLYKGKKFDIRCFMYIACSKPFLVLFNEGYLRCSLNDYSLETFGSQEKMTHITNQSVQKKHPQYKELKDQSV